MAVIVCRQCGQQAREGEDFCPSCGAFLEWEGERVEPTAPGAAPPPPSPATPPAGGAGGAGREGESAPAAGPPPGSWVDRPPGGVPAWTVGPPAGGGRPAASPAPPSGAADSPPDAAPGAAPPPGGPPATPPRSGGEHVTVRCLECGASNPGDRRFCRRCGSSLELVALTGHADSGDSPTSPAPAGDAGPVTLEGPVAPGEPPAAARSPGPPVPDAPRVMARAPGASARKAMQPAEAAARPPVTRPPAQAPEVAPGGPLCSECGTANPPGRRFCRRCGATLAAAAAPERAGAPPRAGAPGWWQRLVAKLRGRDGDGERATTTSSARAAYRSSLDVRYRVLRVVAVVAGAGLLVGSLGLTGYNPIAGVRGLWGKVFPRDKRISELAANADPDKGVDNDFPPSSAVDGDPKTAWAAQWTLGQDDAAAQGCTEDLTFGGADHALVVTMPQPSRLSKLRVQPGLPAGDPDRAGQWKPTKLELRFDDGSCKELTLGDEAGFQEKRIKGPVTRHVRIAILDAAPPADEAAAQAGGNKVSIGEVRIYRPR